MIGRLAGMLFAVVAALVVAAVVFLSTGGNPTRPEVTDALGVLADPDDVYDPVRAGERTPANFRQLLDRDAILPVYDPTFVAAEDASWRDRTPVIGLEIDGDARAYPVSFLDRREMVVDTVGGVPVLVSWCPLCGTAMVHERVVNGREIVFGNQGALFGNAMTWWDHDTGSVWSQPLGEAILGPRSGQTVPLLPSTFTTWEAWRAAHPDTVALDAPGGSASADLDDTVIVVDLGASVAAYPIRDLRDTGIANDIIGGVPVAVVLDPADDSGWAVFSRVLDDRTVTLEVVDGSLRDVETGTSFDPTRGAALEGALVGQNLDLLPGSTSFPEDVRTFWPEARFWPPSIAE